tara:strand:- start:2240 stop:2524 length:285 start_codon:yes stop_codon:yes gene_type:complete
MTTKKSQKTILKEVISQLNGDIDEDAKLHPEYAIKGTGHLYCYQPHTKSFVRIYKNQKVFLISDDRDDNKFLIYTTCGKLVTIEPELLIFTEFD